MDDTTIQKKGSHLNQTKLDQNEICSMFNRIAHRYDLLNRTLSFGQDIIWRNKVANYLTDDSEQIILDLATGTGDLLISLYEKNSKVKYGIGLDMAGKMLELAEKKIIAKNLQHSLSLVKADAVRIPFADNTFNAVTIAFGIRNIPEISKALSEMNRILKTNGRALILEFSLPQNSLLKRVYLLYFRYILPFVGKLVSGDSSAYRHLNQSVETFPYGKEFCQLMKGAGFKEVKANQLSHGIATIYQGSCKPHN